MAEMDNFMVVIQESDVLPVELVSCIVRYGKCLEEMMTKPPTLEEVAWLIQTRGKLVTTSTTTYDPPAKFREYNAGYWCHAADGELEQHISNINLIDGGFDRYSTRLCIFEIAYTGELMDPRSIFLILSKRLDEMGYDDSTTLARNRALEMLSETFKDWLITNPIRLEMFLYASAIAADVIEAEFIGEDLWWPLSGSGGGLGDGILSEVHEEVITKCHQYYGMIKKTLTQPQVPNCGLAASTRLHNRQTEDGTGTNHSPMMEKYFV